MDPSNCKFHEGKSMCMILMCLFCERNKKKRKKKKTLDIKISERQRDIKMRKRALRLGMWSSHIALCAKTCYNNLLPIFFIA